MVARVRFSSLIGLPNEDRVYISSISSLDLASHPYFSSCACAGERGRAGDREASKEKISRPLSSAHAHEEKYGCAISRYNYIETIIIAWKVIRTMRVRKNKNLFSVYNLA